MTTPDDYTPFDPRDDGEFAGSAGGWAAGLPRSVGPRERGESGNVATGRAGERRRGQPALDFRPASDFAAGPKPRRRFLVPGADLFPIGSVSGLYGDGGTGKSLLALQLAMASASGTSWLGHMPKPGAVLFFSAEDDELETEIRLKDIAEGTGLDLAALHDLRIAFLAGRDAILAHEDAKAARMVPTPLFDDLEARIDAFAPSLVILDNLADIFAGNENSKPLARQFVGMLRGLARDRDCTFIVLAHPSLSGMSSGSGTSGNTAWNNSLRSRLYLKRQHDDAKEITDPDFRRLVTMKANYGATGGEIGMRWQNGLFVPTETAATASASLTGLDRMAAQSKVERVFLSLLRLFEDQGRTVSPNRSASWAPKVFAAHPDAEGVSRRQLENAMECLLSARQIEIGGMGPPSRRVQVLRLATGETGD